MVGTEAEPDELDRVTPCPPDGAGPVRPTVPFTGLPPTTDPEEKVTDPTHGDDDGLDEGLMVRFAEAVFAAEAVMVAVCVEEGDVVETWNVAVVCPAGTVTELGTVAAELLLVRLT